MVMRSGLLMGTFMTAMFAVGCGGTANIAQPTSPISVDGTGSSTQPPSGSSSCVASQAQWAVGQRASDETESNDVQLWSTVHLARRVILTALESVSTNTASCKAFG